MSFANFHRDSFAKRFRAFVNIHNNQRAKKEIKKTFFSLEKKPSKNVLSGLTSKRNEIACASCRTKLNVMRKKAPKIDLHNGQPAGSTSGSAQVSHARPGLRPEVKKVSLRPVPVAHLSSGQHDSVLAGGCVVDVGTGEGMLGLGFLKIISVGHSDLRRHENRFPC